jgi:hypothetical protein
VPRAAFRRVARLDILSRHLAHPPEMYSVSTQRVASCGSDHLHETQPHSPRATAQLASAAAGSTLHCCRR